MISATHDWILDKSNKENIETGLTPEEMTTKLLEENKQRFSNSAGLPYTALFGNSAVNTPYRVHFPRCFINALIKAVRNKTSCNQKYKKRAKFKK